MKTKDKYTIKPLKWEWSSNGLYEQYISKGEVHYRVSRWRLRKAGRWSKWGYGVGCEGIKEVKSLAEGKRLCNEHWIGRITQFLKKTN